MFYFANEVRDEVPGTTQAYEDTNEPTGPQYQYDIGNSDFSLAGIDLPPSLEIPKNENENNDPFPENVVNMTTALIKVHEQANDQLFNTANNPDEVLISLPNPPKNSKNTFETNRKAGKNSP